MGYGFVDGVAIGAVSVVLLLAGLWLLNETPHHDAAAWCIGTAGAGLGWCAHKVLTADD